MRRVSPLREFLSSLFFFVCVCVCVCACTETQREREGGREKHKRRSWKDTTQQMQKPLRDLLAQRGGRKEERGRERESGREEHSVHCAAHVDMCEQGAKGARGAHHASHSLTHSLTSLVSPLSPISSARERERVRERKRPRERRKREGHLQRPFFCNVFFFTLALPLVSFLPAPLPDTLLDKQEARPTQ